MTKFCYKDTNFQMLPDRSHISSIIINVLTQYWTIHIEMNGSVRRDKVWIFITFFIRNNSNDDRPENRNIYDNEEHKKKILISVSKNVGSFIISEKKVDLFHCRSLLINLEDFYFEWSPREPRREAPWRATVVRAKRERLWGVMSI